MATPRVFISSTCYDLAEIRDGLISFFQNFGFDVVLSERGDVFYHPDLHTHEACITETSNCQLFVLIIGGRFGGSYKADKAKSITNAEYAAAKRGNCPVFTFIKDEVLSDHNLWQRNKGEAFAADIKYPSIEKQDFSTDIFQFIDEVRSSSTNNAYFPFKRARDLQETLRKQLAAMFFDFLSKRTLERRFAQTTAAVDSLALVSGKIEELVKEIYRHVEPAGAERVIGNIDIESKANEFFRLIGNRANDALFLYSDYRTSDEIPEFDSFEDFLIEAGFFEIEIVIGEESLASSTLTYSIGDIVITRFGEEASKLDLQTNAYIQDCYNAFKSLDKDAKLRLIRQHSTQPPPPRAPEAGHRR